MNLVDCVGSVVVAEQRGDGVELVAGALESVARNWANEFELRFTTGETLTLLEGDAFTVDGEIVTLDPCLFPASSPG